MKILVILLQVLIFGSLVMVVQHQPTAANLNDEQRVKTSEGRGVTKQEARENALFELTNSLLVSVQGKTITEIEVTDTYKRLFDKSITISSGAKLIGVDITYIEVDGGYVAKASMDIVKAAKAYVDYLAPIARRVNKSLEENSLALEELRIYKKILPDITEFETYGQIADIVMSLNHNAQLVEAFEKPRISTADIKKQINDLKLQVTDDQALAAHLLSWDLEQQPLNNIHVCPVFGHDGRRLEKDHLIPATIAGLIRASANNTQPSFYLVGRATAEQDYTRIEYSLVDQQKQSKVIASVKVKLAEKDWQSHQGNKDNRVLLDVSQSFKAVDGIEIASNDLTTTQAKNILPGLFAKPPQFIGFESCLDKAVFSQPDLALHHNVGYLATVTNNTQKGIIPGQNPKDTELSYAHSNITLLLVDADKNFAQTSYECTGRANTYVAEDFALLHDATQFAFENMVDKREACNE